MGDKRDAADVFPGPLVSMAISPKGAQAVGPLAAQLQRMAAEDTTIHIATDHDTGLTIISGTSCDDVRGCIDQITRSLGIDLDVGPPTVRYRETITASCRGEAKVVRMVNGRSHYAHVILAVEPIDPQELLEFRNRLPGDLLARWLPAVERGVRELGRQGILAGHPMIGVRVSLIGGSHHETDSSDWAFAVAARVAFSEAAHGGAAPVLLEPVMAVDVHVPADLLGDVIGDLSARQGLVVAIGSPDGEAITATAEVRLRALLNYADDLRATSHGRASCELRFQRFVRVSQPEPDGDEPVSARRRAA